MTLTIVIVAIVLLVTALVIMTIFGGQMAQFMGILNPWSQGILESNLCQQACATYCQQHPNEASTPWGSLTVQTQSGRQPGNCAGIMNKASGGSAGVCTCVGIQTGASGTATAGTATAGSGGL